MNLKKNYKNYFSISCTDMKSLHLEFGKNNNLKYQKL